MLLSRKRLRRARTQMTMPMALLPCLGRWVSRIRRGGAKSVRPSTLLVISPDSGLMCVGSRLPSSTSGSHCSDCTILADKARRKSLAGPSDLPPDSAKIRKILELLRKIDQRDDEEKTIIFSQFTSMLDLIQPFLKAEGIRHARCVYLLLGGSETPCHADRHVRTDDGSMSKDQREASLEKVRSSTSTRLILISFKAGSTGD
jgi:SNF2 family DNA or RNA helicase